jgi:hypothetical protein
VIFFVTFYLFRVLLEHEPGSRSSSGEIQQDSGDDTEPFRDTSDNDLVIENYPELQIGSLYERNIPIYYCSRFLAYNFLLAGECYQKSGYFNFFPV